MRLAHPAPHSEGRVCPFCATLRELGPWPQVQSYGGRSLRFRSTKKSSPQAVAQMKKGIGAEVYLNRGTSKRSKDLPGGDCSKSYVKLRNGIASRCAP